MSVLTIIQRAAKGIGIPSPAIALAATDQSTTQLVELLNQEARSLAARGQWQALIREATFTTVAAEDQGALSSIVSGETVKYILNDVLWNRTRSEPVCGPKSVQRWQAYKAFPVSSPYTEYRLRGDRLLFAPAPAAGETCAFEYVTKNWCTDSTGTTSYANANADADIPRLDEELLLAGLDWRWRRSKGLSYSEEFASYERQVVDALARDGTKPALYMDGGHALDSVPQAIPRVIGS